MYTRSYKSDMPTIPESYGGVAFREDVGESIPEDAPKSIAKSADIRFTAPEPPDPKLSATEGEESVPTASEPQGFLSSVVSRLPFGLFGGGKALALPNIGAEEILIIGLAIFLFLSKDGDKECALLLLLLLLVH